MKINTITIEITNKEKGLIDDIFRLCGYEENVNAFVYGIHNSKEAINLPTEMDETILVKYVEEEKK